MDQPPGKKDLTQHEFYAHYQQYKGRPRSTIFCGALLGIFLIMVFFVLPNHLPWAMQKLFGLVNATLAMLVVMFAVSEYGKDHPALAAPIFKKINAGVLAGGVLFALVLGWWQTPFAPIKVGIPNTGAISQMLGDELTLAVIVMPNTTLAVIETPVPPPNAVALARQVSGNADVSSQLFKAIAEQRFVEASALADRATTEDMDAEQVSLARGQIEVFSGRYAAALPHFDKAAATSTDVKTFAQQAVAYGLAGNLAKSYEIASKLLDDVRAGSVKGEIALGISLNLKAAIAITSGRFTESLPLLEESQQFWSSSADSPYKAASRNNQAVAYAMLPKKYAGTESQLDGAQAIWNDLYGSDNAHSVGCETNLGVLAISQANYAVAESRLNRALKLAQQQYGEQSPGMFAPLNAQVRLKTILGRYPAAEKFADEAQACTRQSPILELALFAARGALLNEQGDYRGATSSFGKALANNNDGIVPGHVFLAATRMQKCSVSDRQQLLPETMVECQAAIETFGQQLGKTHPLIACAHNEMGWAFLRTDKKPEAKSQFELAQKIVAANKNEIVASPESGPALAGLAQLLPRRQWRESLDDLRKAIEIEAQLFEKVLGATEAQDVQTPAMANYVYEQALLYTENGAAADYPLAVKLFERSIAIREKLLPPTHPLMPATYDGFAGLLKKMGKPDEAAAIEAKALKARSLTAKQN